ncbi:MAG: MFS transporter [Candidatus Sungbacteria bacterium]|uniref:MFS transporter n=1 Tax=Candidatus Sungiibacteriota bacterium TaxID=2750080 RepID=A0A932YWB4_9BACT|nr:MFS transporter [Candidatus Sungbacteria bacterium]
MKFAFLKLNQVILVIIFAQFIFTMAVSLSAPLFAIFVVRDIGAAAAAVGFASAVYWAMKSILQLPIARYLDKNHGEIDDYYSLLAGITITMTGVFLFYFAAELWHIFAIQALIAIGDAFAIPPLYAIFTRHIDSGAEGFEWALQSSFSFGAGGAIGGVLSGILVGLVGIRPLFLVNGTLMLVGLIVLVFLRPYIRPKVPSPAQRVFIEQKRV